MNELACRAIPSTTAIIAFEIVPTFGLLKVLKNDHISVNVIIIITYNQYLSLIYFDNRQ